MVGELVFKEERDRVELLAKIVATLHWAAPIVARNCRTSLENIGFFGPKRIVQDGVTVFVYRLARVYGTDRETLRQSVWNKKAVLLDRQALFDSKRQKPLRGKKAPWRPASVDAKAQYGGVVCLG